MSMNLKQSRDLKQQLDDEEKWTKARCLRATYKLRIYLEVHTEDDIKIEHTKATNKH